MSLIKKLIARADAECRYLNIGEMEQIKQFMMGSDRRLRLVKGLTENRDRIVKQSAKQLFQQRPNLVAPGGNAYGEEMTATCLRDMDYYLRLITYSVATGETSSVEELGLIGVRQMYNSLGTSMSAMAASVRAMKGMTTSLMSTEDASEVGIYFDYLINAFE